MDFGTGPGEVLGGHSSLSVRADEAEEAWRIVTPVLEAWAAGRVALDGVNLEIRQGGSHIG